MARKLPVESDSAFGGRVMVANANAALAETTTAPAQGDLPRLPYLRSTQLGKAVE